MPQETPRGIRTGILWAVMLMLSTWTVTAAGQGVGPATVTVQVDLDAETQRLLTEAEALIGRGRNDDAFGMLSAREFELAGNPVYDYLLGIAALDSGRYSEAIFSLERTLDVQPDFSGARLALARAHYEAGEKAQARSLFRQLLDEQPPAAVRQVVDQYLAALDPRPQRKSRFTPFFDGAVGYDSNANASTDDGNFLGFMLTPTSIGTSSPFAEVGAGFDWFSQTSRQSAWFARVRASHRNNPDASFVDASRVSGQLSFAWRRGSDFGRVGFDGYWGARDGHYNENYGGANLELGHRIGDLWDINVNFRYGAQRYEDSISILDVDRTFYSVGLRRRILERGSIRLDLIGGEDSEKDITAPYGNSKSGGRLSFSASVSENVAVSGSFGILETDYDGLFFGSLREDEQTTALLQMEFRDVFSAGFIITPRVLYVDNDSGLGLYKYDRTEVGVNIRWSPK